MRRKHLIAACVILLSSLCLTQCAFRKDQRAGRSGVASDQQAASAVPDQFGAVLERARRSAGGDRFADAFAADGKISLPGGQIKSLSEFRVGRDGVISVVDHSRKQVEVYNDSGDYVRTIGGSGNEPGAHLWPSDVAEAGAQQLAVSDYQGHRVNIFSAGGELVSSFVYTPEKFSAFRLVYDDAARAFYLFGNRWQRDAAGQVVGADLVHKYTADGEFVASYLPLPDRAKSLDLYSYDCPVADVAKGDLFVALPFDYTIYRLTPGGQLSAYLDGGGGAFKAAATSLDVGKTKPAESYKYVQNWRLTWTPINSLLVAGDELLVQYQTFDPLRYTIDRWSLSAKKKIGTIKTNYAMLTKDADGHLYFLENLEAKDQERYDILRARLKRA